MGTIADIQFAMDSRALHCGLYNEAVQPPGKKKKAGRYGIHWVVRPSLQVPMPPDGFIVT